ncbi:MAG: carbohydrate-binding domain-containing protein [Clostridia bacterium]|nr:carbohydrate-binding domain-containing protein [Clostridia bacterium]
MKKLLTVLMFAVFLLSTCTVFALTGVEAENATYDLNDYFSSRDLSGTWDAAAAVAIDLSHESDVTITEAGVYVLSGETRGTVTVSVGDSDKVQLVLKSVDITAEGSAAIYVENADKVFITLAEGSENTLTIPSFDPSGEIDAAIFAKDDITLNGSGSLTIVSANHGIVGKDDLKITGGTYSITAEGRGIDANDSVRIADGNFTIVSGKDGIRAKNEENADKGYVLIAGGTFDIIAGGGSVNGEVHTESMMMGFRGGWNNSQTVGGTDTGSAKAIKASGRMIILDGAITVDAADDAFHTDGDLTVNGGTLTARSGDDGMHADNTLTINAGSVTISQSYEGIEATAIVINGGDISVTSSDDGLNSSGGSDQSGFWRNDMFASDGSSITINGGNIYVNAQGDGIDSNGDLYVNGGYIVVSGPTSSGNGALDYNGNAVITGGTVIAAGATGMAENFGSASTQASILVNLSGSADTITVSDANGSELFSGTVEKAYQCVVISSPDLAVGQTYTVANSTGSTQITPSSIISGSGSGMGNFGGGFGGGRNGRGNQQQAPDGNQQSPDGQQLPNDLFMPGGQMPGGQTPGGWERHGGGRR